MELTQEIVREFLDYDPLTGALTWRHRHQIWFTTERAYKMWNIRFPGKHAFTSTSHGYLRGDIFNKSYSAHRVIFLWMRGRWPDPEIDHNNHDGTDNRWDNLEETTENAKNKKLFSTNTSGRTGVYWHKQIIADRKKIFLGLFEKFEDAVLARDNAERTYGFHENHGKSRN
jgi:hypothetical protein